MLTSDDFYYSTSLSFVQIVVMNVPSKGKSRKRVLKALLFIKFHSRVEIMKVKSKEL